MTPVLDPEGAHLAALNRLGDFGGQRVLELGCGDGRLTLGIAATPHTCSPSTRTPRPLNARARVTCRARRPCHVLVASGKEIEIKPHSFDLVVFSWSL